MSLVTITGENDYARKAELQRLAHAFTAEYGALSLERVDGEDHEFIRIQEALTSLPFLASKKMVVLTRPTASKQFVEQAEALLSDLPETTDLVLVEPKFDKRSSMYKFLKKVSDFREFNKLDGAPLASWLVAEAKTNGATLSSGDARYLIERVGTNQQMLVGEVTKLSLYAPAITRATIDLLTEPTPQSTIFELVDAAFTGQDRQALGLYDEQRRLKVEPIQIVAMLAWQLHVLALVLAAGDRGSDAIARDAKISPYTVSKTQRLARRVSAARLRTLVNRLVTIDQRSKRESIDLDEALRHYLVAIHE